MVNPVITIENLRVIYNQGKSNETRSLDGVNLKIFPREYIIVHGPSGCGKSTLLYSIAGLQAPTYGEVTIEDKKLSQMKEREKVELHQVGVGMIFQAFYLISSLSVIDNVCLPRVFRGEDPEKRKSDALVLLRRFGIAEQANKFPGQLSGGQKQRVAIARALINNPQIILADEPVGNLDSESAESVLQILKELNEVDKRTIIMVTHNSEYLHYADRVIHMKDGIIVSLEVIEEKRPISVVKEEVAIQPEEISTDLKLLMRMFKNLSPQQAGVLIVPFKAKQLLSHVVSEFTEEQLTSAENYLKEFLFRNIDIKELEKSLDLDYDEGGAGWNKRRAIAFAQRVRQIMNQVEALTANPETAANTFSDYLLEHFNIKLSDDIKLRFRSFIKLRIDNKIDRFSLQQRLDTPKILGGIGLYKTTAEKVVREIEVVMLLKYSA
ncbi:MAG: ABC transporter ATP-binding protein [Candidatus Moranbacteria bacterium]|nr:ABC transporter ATP-binding protein [Candidatus Moranbacteria bacterium]